MTKFKVHENDIERACDLANRLGKRDWRVWFSINQDDMSACKWWIAPLGTEIRDARMCNGGIGALINHLRTACYDSGALQRPRRIARRNPIRLSSDANGKCWTVHNGG